MVSINADDNSLIWIFYKEFYVLYIYNIYKLGFNFIPFIILDTVFCATYIFPKSNSIPDIN